MPPFTTRSYPLNEFVSRNFLKHGFILSLILTTLFVLPARISEGQLRIDPINVIISQFFIFLLCWSSWIVIILLLFQVNILANWQKVIVGLLCCILLSIGSYLISSNFCEDFPLNPLSKMPWIWRLIRLSNRGILLFSVFFPTAYFLLQQKELYESRINLEITKNEKLTNQVRLLQQQLTPHFLFNSLSVLKFGEMDNWSKKYIVELSQLLSYQLYETNKKTLVEVSTELQFVRSYSYILQERFEDGLQINIHVEKEIGRLTIPPCTIQMVVENAIKHNKISRCSPLKIEIINDHNFIMIRNNIQRKVKMPKNNSFDAGIGLENIRERYHLLANSDIVVTENDNFFIVKVPLLPEL